MMQILVAIGVLLFVGSAASHLTLWKDFKYYKVIYKQLPTYRFYQFWGQIYNDRNMCGSFIWFMDGNHPQLAPGYYIFSDFYVWLCPYSAYWLIKYRRWMKKNCKPEIIYESENPLRRKS